MPVLFYTIGYPGAGKTSFAKALSRWLGGVHLQADRVGLALFVVPTFSQAERLAVYQHMDYQAMTALNQGQYVLYDGTINNHEQREHLQKIAERNGAKAVGIWLRVPTALAKERAGRLRNAGVNGIGGRIVPPEIFDQHVRAFQAPDESEIIATINGNEPFSLQYPELQEQLQERRIVRLPRFLQL